MNSADSIARTLIKARLLAAWPYLALAIGAAVFLAVAVSTCHGPTVSPIPVALDSTLQHHAIASAVDTAKSNRLVRSAAAARAAQQADSVRVVALEQIAGAERSRADSLRALVSLSLTASDSAAQLQAAYEARSLEADSLLATITIQHDEIAQATRRGDSLDVALQVTTRRAARADSVIAAAVAVVRASAAPCRVARFISCPSRTVSVLAGAVLGVVALHSLSR